MKKIFLLILLLSLAISPVFASFVEIGDATSSTVNIPLNGYWDYSWSNSIYTTAQVGAAIDITELQFNVSNNPTNYLMSNQTIYMKNVVAGTNVSNPYPDPASNGFTLVYDGSVTFTGSGWQGVTLLNPFVYDGTSDLQIIWINEDGTYANGNPNFHSTDMGHAVAAYKYNDGSFPTSNGSIVNYVADIKLGYVPVPGTPDVATQIAPLDGSIDQAPDVMLEWSLGADTDLVDLYLSTTLADMENHEATALVVDDVYTTSFVTSALTEGTEYFWQVVTINSGSGIEFTSPVWSFTTIATTPTISLNPTSIDFGTFLINVETTQQAIVVSNTSDIAGPVTEISLTNSTNFELISDITIPYTFDGNSNFTVYVKPLTQTAGNFTGILSVKEPDPNNALLTIEHNMDLSLTVQDVTVATFPFTESFDTNVLALGWSIDPVVSGDSWEIFNSNPGYGASADATGNGGYFMGVDDSSPQLEVAHLYSRPFNFTGVTAPTLTFNYWIGTANNTSELNVDVITADNVVTTITTLTEPAGASEWTPVSLNLADFVDQTVTLDFRVIEDQSGYRGDVCLDDVHIYQATQPITLVTPQDHAFHLTNIGWNSTAQTFTVENIAQGTLTVSQPLLTGDHASSFIVTDINSYPVDLLAGESITFNVIFNPNTVGDCTATITITDNTAIGETTINLTGIGYGLNAPTNLASNADVSEVALSWDVPVIGELKHDNGVVIQNLWVTHPSSTDHMFYSKYQAPIDGTLNEIAMYLINGGINEFFESAKICSDNGSGSPDLSNPLATFSADEFPALTFPHTWVTFTPETAIELSTGDIFYIVLQWPEGNESGPYIAASTLGSGSSYRTDDGGSTWTPYNAEWFMRGYMSPTGRNYGQVVTIGEPVVNTLPASNVYSRSIKSTDSLVAQRLTRENQTRETLLSYTVKRGIETGVYDNTFTGITEPTYLDNTVVTNTNYFYTVSAVYAEGESVDSNEISALPTAAAPIAPTLIAPVDVATDVNYATNLNWSDIADVDEYYIYIDTDNTFASTTAITVTESEYTFNSDAASTYYWYVIASNTNGDSAPSTTWSYTTGSPLAPTFPNPANLATERLLGTSLSWINNGVLSAIDVYFGSDLALVTAKDSSTLIVDNEQGNLASVDSDLLGALVYETTYYWLVSAKDTNGSISVDSDVWAFTTTPDPVLPLPIFVDFEGTFANPAEITQEDCSINATHGNNSNGMFKNLWGTDHYANITFQIMNNITPESEMMFDYRIVGYSSYPTIPQTLATDEYIKILISTNEGVDFTDLYEINSTNHTPATDFTTLNLSLAAYAGERIVLKVVAFHTTGDYYVDFDNFAFLNGPQTTLSTDILAFGENDMNSISDPQVVTITNTGVGILNISNLEITGTDAAMFAFITADGTSMALANGEQLEVSVTFEPTTDGDKTAILAITDDLGRAINNVTLTGTSIDATLPLAELSTDALAFGTVTNNTVSTAQVVTITNIGGAILNISNIAITGTDAAMFAYSTEVDASMALAFEEDLAISVTFEPTTAGDKTATLVITDDLGRAISVGTLNSANARNSRNANNVTLTGTPGVPEAPTTPIPNDVATDVSIVTNLNWTNNGTVGSINAYFGTDLALVTAKDASTLIVEDELVNLTSIANSVIGTLDYVTTYYWLVTAESAVGAESVDSAVWSFTTIASAFPNADTIFDGPRVVNQGMPMEPYYGYTITQNIYLQSELNAIGGSIAEISYLYNNYSAWSETIQVYMGHTDKTEFTSGSDWVTSDNLTLVYDGSITVDTVEPIVNIVLDTEFDYNNTDNLVVVFLATQNGYYSSSAEFYNYAVPENRSITRCTDSAPYDITLPPTGYLRAFTPVTGFVFGDIPTTPVAQLSTDAMAFGEVDMDAVSVPQIVTITNVGIGTLNISNIAITGTDATMFAFTTADGASMALANGEELEVSVTFEPTTTAGDKTATLVITDDLGRAISLNNSISTNSRATNEVTLTGTSVDSSVPVAELNTVALMFGNTPNNTVSSAHIATITNIGGGTLNIANIDITGTDAAMFAYSTAVDASMALAAGEALAISVTFEPTTAGDKTATLVITDDLGRAMTASSLNSINSRTKSVRNSRNGNNVTLTGSSLIPEAPTTPIPNDVATDVAKTTNLNWTNNGLVGAVDVYFGTDLALVTAKDVSTLIVENELVNLTSVANAVIGTLDFTTTYYWLVTAETATGTESVDSAVWSFTTMAPAFPDADTTFDGPRVVNIGMPMEPYYGYTMTQNIYYQAELNPTDDMITQISYLYNNTYGWTETIQVYMGHTDKTEYSSSSDWVTSDNLTLVYDGSITVDTVEPIVNITLDTEFAYNNTDNLVVVFLATQAGYAGSNNEFYNYAVAENRSITARNDSSPYDITNPSTGTLKAFTPVTGFNFGPGAQVQPDAPLNVVMEYTDADALVITWDVVTGLTYKVYASAIPNPGVDDADYAEVAHVDAGTYTYDGTEGKMFFKIIATTDAVVRSRK